MSAVLYSLTENVWPSTRDKVPRQGLANHIVGDVDNGGSGILLSDFVWVQSVLQVPEKVRVCKWAEWMLVCN